MATIKNFPNNVDEYQYAQDAMKWMYSRTQGVYGANGNLSVTALPTPAMSVNVSDGLGWLRDHLGNGCVFWNDNFYANSALLNLTIDAADGVQNRIDRVVVSWTTANYTQKPEIKILKGTLSASSPQPPAITNNTIKRELSLAKIAVNAGTTAITSAMITDERLDGTVCGLVTETVAVDTSVVQSQMTALLNQLQYDIEQAEAGAVLTHHATHAAGGVDELQVTTGMIADEAVGTDQLDNACVTAAKLAAGAVTTEKLSAGAVTAAKLANGAYVPAAGGTFTGAVTLGGALVLSSAVYGDALPAAGTAGRIFFKKV
jgi:hypothetical protein